MGKKKVYQFLHLQEGFLLSFSSSSRNSFIGEWDIARCMARRISPGYFQNAGFRLPAQREHIRLER
jgi:hypothetical protein